LRCFALLQANGGGVDKLMEIAQQGSPAALMQPEDWDQLCHSTARDLKLTGRQDISR
jgi:hypothetical protein